MQATRYRDIRGTSNMVTPFSPVPQAAQAPYQPAPPQQPALPKTSGALVFQIFNPVNYAEGSGAPGSAAPTPNAGPTSDAFQRSVQTAPNPAAPPQQQLLDAYNSAVNARNAAEQARQGYLNM